MKKTKKQFLEQVERQEKKLEHSQVKEENDCLSAQKLFALEKALDTIDIGVTITDVSGKIIYTNRAEAELHGYSVSELIGQNAGILGAFELWDEHNHTNKLELIRNMKNFSLRRLNTKTKSIRNRMINQKGCYLKITQR